MQNLSGGGCGDGDGLYGTLARKGTSIVFALLILLTGMCMGSTLVDAGAGLGRPLAHAAILGLRRVWGFEMNENRVKLAKNFFRSHFRNVFDKKFGK